MTDYLGKDWTAYLINREKSLTLGPKAARTLSPEAGKV
jgi:hypothetical protein